MARQSGRSGGRSSGFGGRSTSTGRTSSTSSRPTQPPVSRTQNSAPVQQSSGGMMGGLGSTIVQGMAFGGGSAIGHQVVRSMFGGSSEVPEKRPEENTPMENTNSNNQQKTSPCSNYNFKFIECLKFNDNNISSCQNFFDDLKSCERSLI
jgi:hypothetical protein